jgi:hypothetical protein
MYNLLGGLNLGLENPTHFSRRLRIIKQIKSKLHTIFMEDYAQNLYYIQLKFIPSKLTELTKMKQVLQTSKHKHKK